MSTLLSGMLSLYLKANTGKKFETYLGKTYLRRKKFSHTDIRLDPRLSKFSILIPVFERLHVKILKAACSAPN